MVVPEAVMLGNKLAERVVDEVRDALRELVGTVMLADAV